MKVAPFKYSILSSLLLCGVASLPLKAADTALSAPTPWYSTNFGATQSSGVYDLLTNVTGATFTYNPSIYQDGIFSEEFIPAGTGVGASTAYIKGTEAGSAVLNSALGLYSAGEVSSASLSLTNFLHKGATHYFATGFTASFDYNVYSGDLLFGYTVDGVTQDVVSLSGSGTYTMNSFDFSKLSISYGESIQLFWTETSKTDGSAWIDNLQVTAVPEPSTYAFLLGVGTLGLVGWRRFRRK